MIILASKSPRRQEILNLLDLEFKVIPSEFDEEGVTASSSVELATNLAISKGLEVASKHQGPVLSADTVVEVDGVFLGKPKDYTEAFKMLKKLSGRCHNVVSGVAICEDGEVLGSTYEITKVYFHQLSDKEIDWYIATNDPFDKAGGYGIQTKSGIFVAKIEGCYFNVVGLPLSRTANLLRQLGLFKLGDN